MQAVGFVVERLPALLKKRKWLQALKIINSNLVLWII